MSPSAQFRCQATDNVHVRDAKFIRSELTKHIEDEGKNVIVVMHSYGGVVGTEAVHESLGKKAREVY